MPYKLSFPGMPFDDGAYTGLEDENEVYEAVLNEVRQSITDMGSEGYDPDGYLDKDAYALAEEVDDTDIMNDLWQEATDKAIDHQVTLHAPGIFKELWTIYETEGEELGMAKTAKLPDGVTIKLTEED